MKLFLSSKGLSINTSLTSDHSPIIFNTLSISTQRLIYIYPKTYLYLPKEKLIQSIKEKLSKGASSLMKAKSKYYLINNERCICYTKRINLLKSQAGTLRQELPQLNFGGEAFKYPLFEFCHIL